MGSYILPGLQVLKPVILHPEVLGLQGCRNAGAATLHLGQVTKSRKPKARIPVVTAV